MIAKAELALYRERMCALVEMHDQDKTAELALSGGVDSMTVLFAMLETGRKPTCFTFYLQDTPSEDLLSSQAVCKRFGLKHRAVEIPWDIRKLAHDVRHLILRAEVLKKTIIQCMHPWLYLYPAMESDLALCGLGGDDLLCTQRKVQVLLNMKGEQALRESGYRKCYSSDLNFSAANIIRLGEEYGKRLIDVYDDRELEAWFFKHDVKELNSPFEKAASVLAFSDWFEKGPFYRHHSAYQINSKLKVLHEQLLADPEFNRRNAKDLIAVYSDMKNGLA